jgi:hypothetical protein
MNNEQPRKKLDLTDPSYVDSQNAQWNVKPASMIVIEFLGTGDPYFGGCADDQALGTDGRIKERASRSKPRRTRDPRRDRPVF